MNKPNKLRQHYSHSISSYNLAITLMRFNGSCWGVGKINMGKYRGIDELCGMVKVEALGTIIRVPGASSPSP